MAPGEAQAPPGARGDSARLPVHQDVVGQAGAVGLAGLPVGDHRLRALPTLLHRSSFSPGRPAERPAKRKKGSNGHTSAEPFSIRRRSWRHPPRSAAASVASCSLWQVFWLSDQPRICVFPSGLLVLPDSDSRVALQSASPITAAGPPRIRTVFRYTRASARRL